MAFELNKKETRIDFFRSNPALWNHLLAEYWDQNLRGLQYEKLAEQFDGKFTNRNGMVCKLYAREKNLEMVQKSQVQVLLMCTTLHGNFLINWSFLMLLKIMMPLTYLLILTAMLHQHQRIEKLLKMRSRTLK